jgi:hypothetical protein
LVVLLAGVSGLLALSNGAAHAIVATKLSTNHCEPVRRR